MSATPRLLRSWVRIPPGAWIFVCCVCCALSGRGLCDELITRPEESYWLWCVVVCDLETSRMRRPWPLVGSQRHKKKNYFGPSESVRPTRASVKERQNSAPRSSFRWHAERNGKASRAELVSSLLPIHRKPEAVSPGAEELNRTATHSPPSRDNIKNAWSIASTHVLLCCNKRYL